MKTIQIFTLLSISFFLSNSLFARPYIDLGYGFTNSNPNSSATQEGHKDLDFSSYSVSVGYLSGYLGNEFNFHYGYKDNNNFFKHFSYSTIFALPADDWEVYFTLGAGVLDIQYQEDINSKYQFTIPLGVGFAYYFADRNSIGINYKYYATFSDVKINTFIISYRRYFNLSNKNR